MSIDVAFMSLFVRKNVLETRFPGGVAGFRERFPRHAEDHYLFRLCSMDGQDFQQYLDELREAGLDPERDIVAAEMTGGPEQGAEGIEFIRDQHDNGVFAHWIAIAPEELSAAETHGAPPEERPARPKLEVVCNEPAPADNVPGESPAEASPAAPPRGVRESVILRQETPECSTTEQVTLQENGNLVVSGHDTGDLPLHIWGDENYEYWRTVVAEDVPRILLGLIRERFGSDAEIKDWLDANGIEHQFNSWS